MKETKKNNLFYFISLVLFLFALDSVSSPLQFTTKELAKRPEIETLLKAAKITDSKEIGEGVTKPYKLYMKKGDIEINACWKNPKGQQFGFLEGWRYEIAAYEMDKLLDLNMIPPTIERRFKGKRGSLQYWISGGFNDLERQEQNVNIPKEHFIQWEKRKYMTRAFDCLIGNEDRTQQNVRYTEDWRTILIDHSRSFRSSSKFKKQLMYGKNGIKGVKLIRKLPREFVNKIRDLDFDKIKNAVGTYLKKKEIKAILIRQKLLLKEIEETIKEKGEENFYY